MPAPKHRWNPYLTGGWAAPGWAGVGGEARVLSCRFGRNGREAGVRASTEFTKALWDLQLIILGAVEAISDFVHYPLRVPTPAPACLGRA